MVAIIIGQENSRANHVSHKCDTFYKRYFTLVNVLNVMFTLANVKLFFFLRK